MVFRKRQKIEFKHKIQIAIGLIITVVGGVLVASYQSFITKDPQNNELTSVESSQLDQLKDTTSINLKELYELDETETAYLKDGDSSTFEFNTGIKTAGFYLTSFFNFYTGIKKNINVKKGEYLCNEYDMKSIEAASHIPILNPNAEQHSEVKPHFYNSRIKNGFAKYNPKIIKWAALNLIPDPKEKNIQGFIFQEIYNELYKNNFRLIAESYLYFSDEKSYQDAQNEYTNAMKEEGFNGVTYLFNKYPNGGCDFCFDRHITIGFWLRRGIDGTNEELWQALVKVLKIYDSKWFRTRMKVDKTLWVNE